MSIMITKVPFKKGSLFIVTSRDVADEFGLKHTTLVKHIKSVMERCSPEFRDIHFHKANNEEFYLTRDALFLLNLGVDYDITVPAKEEFLKHYHALFRKHLAENYVRVEDDDPDTDEDDVDPDMCKTCEDETCPHSEANADKALSEDAKRYLETLKSVVGKLAESKAKNDAEISKLVKHPDKALTKIIRMMEDSINETVHYHVNTILDTNLFDGNKPKVVFKL